MPKRKIRHAIVQYTSKNADGQPTFETAFRNQIVDIPADQVERLDELGATVPEAASLERPGAMMTLPDTATDAEITAWVMGASNSEVEALVRERPVMASRIEAAHEAVKMRFQEQNLHLGGLKAIAEESPAQAEDDLIGTAEPVDTAQAGESAAPNPAAEEALPQVDADRLVKGNAQTVTAYIADNPRTAAAVLQAEARLAEKEKRDMRVSVVKAAEAAAGFTAQ